MCFNPSHPFLPLSFLQRQPKWHRPGGIVSLSPGRETDPNISCITAEIGLKIDASFTSSVLEKGVVGGRGGKIAECCLWRSGWNVESLSGWIYSLSGGAVRFATPPSATITMPFHPVNKGNCPLERQQTQCCIQGVRRHQQSNRGHWIKTWQDMKIRGR